MPKRMGCRIIERRWGRILLGCQVCLEEEKSDVVVVMHKELCYSVRGSWEKEKNMI